MGTKQNASLLNKNLCFRLVLNYIPKFYFYFILIFINNLEKLLDKTIELCYNNYTTVECHKSIGLEEEYVNISVYDFLTYNTHTN